jgi:TrmH family RNA methyltransferase
MEIIKSFNNSLVKQVIKLKKSGERKKENLIVIEGCKEICLAREGGIKIKKFFYSRELDGKKEKIFLEWENIKTELSTDIFKKISYRENPDGFLILAEPKYLELEELKLNKNSLLIILDEVEKPGNLGAILRTADAGGLDAVLISNSKTDIYNHNVIRASRGTVFTNQIAAAERKEIIKWLKDKGVKIFVSTPDADKKYSDIDFSGSSAIIMGSEDKGASEEWIKAADETMQIPMRGKIDSLNVSVSAGIIIFEALRQREGG